MNQQLLDFKMFLLGTGLFKRVSKNNNWYRVQTCPYCGDTKSHLYVCIDLESDAPVGYNCFKSNCKGTIDKTFLDYYGLEWKDNIPKGKRSHRLSNNNDYNNIDESGFDLDIEHMKIARDYISYRLGVTPTDEELDLFRIPKNPVQYSIAILNSREINVKTLCWFICTNGMLIGRNIHKKKDGWEKFTGNANLNGRALYMIKNQFDLYKPINVCICEGIMDAIGLYYHGGVENGIYIACLGRDYMSAVKYILDKGIFGESVYIRIYKDADVSRVKIDNSYCQFFKSVNVYMNTSDKDYGVPEENITIERIIL